MNCPFCPDPLDPDADSTRREVLGWEEKRAAGGTNHVILRTLTGRYAHASCIVLENTKKKAGAGSEQRGLFR